MALGASAANRLGAILGAGEGAGGLKLALITLTGDNAYPTGGWPTVTSILEAAGLDITNKIYALIPITQAGYEWDYIAATDKLKVYQQPSAAAAGASPECPANAANLNGLAINALCIFE
jgi:hypothetical protein